MHNNNISHDALAPRRFTIMESVSGAVKEKIRQLALQEFDLVGFCTPEVEDYIKEAYEKWLAKGYHAGMNWMERNKEVRKNPSLLLSGVQSIIVVALSYARSGEKASSGCGKIARYARSRDYHHVFRGKMKRFMQEAQALFQKEAIHEQILSACDTKPVFERYFAWKAGLGFIGRNTMLITKEFGSYVMLGCFLTTLKIEPDTVGEGTCGKCTRCLDACPTKALVGPRELDGSKCIAYWTIEHKGEFSEIVPSLSGNLFGCDICQEVCPYNKKELMIQENELQAVRVPETINPEEILAIPSSLEFTARFAGTPLMRAGFEGMKRNAKVLEQNSNCEK